MAINKIIYNGGTLIDLTGDTVSTDTLLEGYTAHDRSGTLITGMVIDGDLLSYGLTDRTSPLVGVGQVGYMEVE